MADSQETLDFEEGQVVVVHLGSEAYGIWIEHIHTVIVLQEITMLPQMPRWVRGLMNLRGQVLPVIDLRVRFDLESTEDGPKTRVVIVNVDGVSAGLVVDEVSEVLTLAPTQLERPSGLIECKARECITAIAKAGSQPLPEKSENERLILILDLAKVLSGSLEEDRKARKGKAA